MNGPGIDELKQNIMNMQVAREKEAARDLMRQRKHMDACMHLMTISSIYRRAAYLYPPEVAENLFSLASSYESLTLNIRNKERGGSVHELVKVEDNITESIIIPEKPTETWDHIGGAEDAKLKLKNFSGHERAFIIYGVPGSGKRTLVRALAHNRELDFYEIHASTILSGYFGDPRRVIDMLFDKAMRSPGAVLFLEGIDTFTKEKTSFQQTKGIMLYLMAKIEEVHKLRETGTYVIASATEPWKMDPDIPEHLPVRIHAPMPDDASRALIFKIHLNGADSSGVNMENLVAGTKGFTGKQIAGICHEALVRMVLEQNPGMEEINVRTLQKNIGTRPLSDDDLRDLVGKTEPSPAPEEEYGLWKKEYGG